MRKSSFVAPFLRSSPTAKSAPTAGFIKRGTVAGLLVLMLATAAGADIVCKDIYDPGEPIIVQVTATDIPAGAHSKGKLTVSGVSGTWQPNPDRQEFGVWAAAGTHIITASGAWLLTDEAGKALDYGRYDYSKSFTVKGGTDPPVPPEPPLPGGKWQVAFFFESSDLDTMPLSQVDMISGLAFREELKAKGHVFVRGFDKDARGELIVQQCEGGVCRTTTAGTKWKAFWDATQGKTFPGIVIAPVAGGKCQYFPLPTDRAALYKLLDGATK